MRIGFYYIALLVIVFWISGCNMLEYHPYARDINGETGLTKKNLDRIAKIFPKETIKFVFFSDTQTAYDETKAAIKDINRHKDIDFVLHGGDLTDFALPTEFEMIRDELKNLEKPWVTAIGNHDCIANGKRIYEKMFGETDYSFQVGTTYFIVINSNSLEFDDINVPDLHFLEKKLSEVERLGNIETTVIMLHTHPGDEAFDNNVIGEFGEIVRKFPNVFCLSGHTHHLETIFPLGEDIPFHIVSDISRRKYLVFTINKDNYDIEICSF